MIVTNFINLAYVAAAILFIFGIKMLGSAVTARRGNLFSSLGMIVAVAVTLLNENILGYKWLVLCVLIGALIGIFTAKFVKMTAMPELVALFNGFGAEAAALPRRGGVAISTHHPVVNHGFGKYARSR